MTKKTREELIREYAEFTADRMSEDTLKRIAVITLLANIDPNSTLADWEDYVARMDPHMESEDLLQMIQPHVIMTKPVKARSAEVSES
tara:strand:- start:1334 stop:1597 length:264 start_codon:yes stop_codon:yes gene_type:complete